MSWSFKYVGNYAGIEKALLDGGGQYNRVNGRVEVPDSYKVARDVILTQLLQRAQTPEIGWVVEAWGGDDSAGMHIHFEPCNLRVA